MEKKLIKYFVVNAFTDTAFKGNPAAVCLLEEEQDEKWLQAVVSEFNLPSTCFMTRLSDSSDGASEYPRFRLRWFTPVAEASLCGHATLAASHAVFANGLVSSGIIEYVTLSGILTAKKVPQLKKTDVLSTGNHEENEGFLTELDFPVVPTIDFNSADAGPISKALNDVSVMDIRRTSADDLLVMLPSPKDVAELQPQFDDIRKCPGRGIIVTAVAPPESGFDFYSRVFAPKYGVNEDSVTGSAHCALAPYWSKKLGKSAFMAYQASARSGVLDIHLDKQNQRVLLRGKAVTVMEGTLLV